MIRDEVDWKKLVADLKKQWGLMWKARLEDKLRAEGIAAEDYPQFFIERGLILSATRDFKPPTFAEVIQKHVPDSEKYVPPNPAVGGWGKFIRDSVPSKNRIANSRRARYHEEKQTSKGGQSKKGGRGWLHK